MREVGLMVRRASPPRTKERAIEIYGEGEVQECLQCGTWYSKHSAYPCFACAVGMKKY